MRDRDRERGKERRRDSEKRLGERELSEKNLSAKRALQISFSFFSVFCPATLTFFTPCSAALPPSLTPPLAYSPYYSACCSFSHTHKHTHRFTLHKLCPTTAARRRSSTTTAKGRSNFGRMPRLLSTPASVLAVRAPLVGLFI